MILEIPYFFDTLDNKQGNIPNKLSSLARHVNLC